MRHFAWLCVVVGIFVTIAVPLKVEREVAASVGSTDYQIWSALEDKHTWRPAGLRSAMWWDAGIAALGVMVLAIRRPDRRASA